MRVVLKMESTMRTLRTFDFQWTKILYQNNLEQISLMGARENVCQILQNYILHTKFSEIYLWNYNSCEIWPSFSWTSMRNFLWCYYRWFITSLAREKCKKNAIFFKLFCYKVFVHWKLKLLNFLVDSVLIFFDNLHMALRKKNKKIYYYDFWEEFEDKLSKELLKIVHYNLETSIGLIFFQKMSR